jgi:hypothetical protein
LADPAQATAMDADELVTHAAAHKVRMLRPKARQVIAAAREAICVPETQRRAAQQLLAEDIAAFDAVQQAIADGDTQLAQLLPQTPAGGLASVPGIGVVTASYYGAALGDPNRFANADAAYRYCGLTPTSYESAGRKATNTASAKSALSSCARPSSCSGPCFLYTIPISPLTSGGSWTQANGPSWPRSRWGIGLTAWPSRSCAPRSRMTPSDGPRGNKAAGSPRPPHGRPERRNRPPSTIPPKRPRLPLREEETAGPDRRRQVFAATTV